MPASAPRLLALKILRAAVVALLLLVLLRLGAALLSLSREPVLLSSQLLAGLLLILGLGIVLALALRALNRRLRGRPRNEASGL